MSYHYQKNIYLIAYRFFLNITGTIYLFLCELIVVKVVFLAINVFSVEMHFGLIFYLKMSTLVLKYVLP